MKRPSARTVLISLSLIIVILVAGGCDDKKTVAPTTTGLVISSGPLAYSIFPAAQWGVDTSIGQINDFDHMVLDNFGNSPVKIIRVEMIKVPTSVRVVSAVSEGTHDYQMGLATSTWPYEAPGLSWFKNFGANAVVPRDTTNPPEPPFDDAIVSIGLTATKNGTYPIFGVKIVYAYQGKQYTEGDKGFSIVLCVGSAAQLSSGCSWPIESN